MFASRLLKIQELAEIYPNRIEELEKLFVGNVNIYIDHANVRPWSNKLHWHIDYKRLRQFLTSFDNVKKIKIYKGQLAGNLKSKEELEQLADYGYEIITKDVKIMKQSIDVSSIALSSPVLLEQFVRKCLLKKYDLETIEYLNNKFQDMNKTGIYYIEDLKCNFDVEIGRDMLIDFAMDNLDTFILWSGDSDFASPIKQLLDDNKKVVLFATARKVSTELNELQNKGLFIFEIQKIRNFICWRKEIQDEIKAKITQKGSAKDP